MVRIVVVFLAFTVQSPDFWYRREWARAHYRNIFVSSTIVRKLKFLNSLGILPGIGVYGVSERKYIDYSRIKPSFIEITMLRFGSKGRIDFLYRSRGDKLDCTSEEFMLKLKKLGLLLSERIMFHMIDDASWSKLKEELNIKPPEWWESLRRDTENKILQRIQERFKEGRIYETVDGHLVRSEAEVIIDNWLYYNNIVHAYEFRLPSEEEMYCDFYLPKYNVYIEYWGVKGIPEYEERKKKKLKVYRKLGLIERLVQLNAEDIKNIDNVLKRKLAKYGIAFT